jgi:hypothetical protein
MTGWRKRMVGLAFSGVMTGVFSAASEGSASGSVLQYDCVVQSAKSGPIGGICDLFAARLAAAFPGQTVQRGPEPDVVLVVDSAGDFSLALRIDWRGHPPGQMLGTVRRDAPLDDGARARLMDELLLQAPG